MNKIKPWLKILLLCCFLSVGNVSETQAQLKVGASETAGSVSGFVQKAEAWVQTQVNTAAQKVQEFVTGPKVQAAIEKYRAIKEDITATVTDLNDAYSDTMDSVSGAQSHIGAIQEGFGEMEEEMMEEYNNIKESQVGSAADLTIQLNDINKQLEDRKTVVSEELAAKAQAAQDNYDIMQSMLGATSDEADKAVLTSEMSALEEEISGYNASLESLSGDDADSYLSEDSEYQSLLTQKQDIEAQLAALGAAGAELALGAAEKWLNQSDAQKQEEYNKVIADNFLKKGEPNTAENIERVAKYRRKVFKEDVEHVLYSSIALKLQLDDDLERLTTKQKNVAAADYKMTAGNMMVEQKIEDIKILYNYTSLMIADLRLKTSQNMLNQDYRLKNYDKNPAALNLDNYIFTKDDIPSDEGKKSFLDKVAQ